MDYVFRRLRFKELMEKAPVSAALVIINVAVFIYGYVGEAYFDEMAMVYKGGLIRFYMDATGEYWRIFTSGFIHFDLIHLLFNVGFGIYIISSGLERLMGSFRFALFYFFTLLASGAGVYLFEDPYTLTAGASGAIYGVMGALLFITLQRPGMVGRAEAASIRNLIFINLAFTFLFSGISVLGHLSGFASGLILAYILVPHSTNEYPDNVVYNYTVENDDEEEDDWWVN